LRALSWIGIDQLGNVGYRNIAIFTPVRPVELHAPPLIRQPLPQFVAHSSLNRQSKALLDVDNVGPDARLRASARQATLNLLDQQQAHASAKCGDYTHEVLYSLWTWRAFDPGQEATRPASCRLPSRRGEPFADRVASEVGDRAQFKLAHDVASVHFDRSGGDAQLAGDTRRAHTLGNQLQHFALPAA